MNNRGSEQNLF